jgi:hypothetical protein
MGDLNCRLEDLVCSDGIWRLDDCPSSCNELCYMFRSRYMSTSTSFHFHFMFVPVSEQTYEQCPVGLEHRHAARSKIFFNPLE